MLKMSLGLATSATVLMMFAYGCSSSETTVGGNDGGTTPTDGSTTKDAKTSGDGSTSGGACEPGDVASFKPPAWKGPKQVKGACTDLQITTSITCAFDQSADQDACKVYQDDKANEPCENCIYTASTEPTQGAVSIQGSSGRLNRFGCLALAEGVTTASSCGAKLEAMVECGDAACDANCPTDDQAGIDAYNKCVEAALSAGCESYATPADACYADLQKANAAGVKACLGSSGDSTTKRAIGVAKVFCGSGTTTTDGGTDAAKDAPAEGG